MGNEQGLRLALQASRAGSVTPVLHQFSGQSQARRKALPVKQRIARFDSGDRSQHAAVVYGKDIWPLTPWTGVRIPVGVPRARSRRRLRTGDPYKELRMGVRVLRARHRPWRPASGEREERPARARAGAVETSALVSRFRSSLILPHVLMRTSESKDTSNSMI